MQLKVESLGRCLGERTLFEGLSFAVDPAETVAVQGPSGSGKTMLLRLLAWLDPPDAGWVSLDDRRPEQWGATLWRSRVAYVAQRPALLPGTPADYADSVRQLAVQRGRAGGDPVEIARQWGLPPEAWLRPWSDLSGGEQQRAALAVTLSREPEVLLLDEPTAALDADAVHAVEQTLKGRQAVWVTHDVHQAGRVASRVLEIAR